jgi:hypothetical protein
MSYGAEKIVKAAEVVPDNEEPICVVIGAIAKGILFFILIQNFLPTIKLTIIEEVRISFWYISKGTCFRSF